MRGKGKTSRKSIGHTKPHRHAGRAAKAGPPLPTVRAACAAFPPAGPSSAHILAQPGRTYRTFRTKRAFPAPAEEGRKKKSAPLMPANASNKGRLHTAVFLCAACLFLRKIFPWGKAPTVRGPFGFQNSLRQTGRRDAQGGGSTRTGMDERPSGKSTPQHKARCRRKALPLNGNFCAQPLQIFLTGTKGICGKLPCFASKIAVSGVLCGFGRAALEEGSTKKFSKSDGLPGVLRVPGVKAARPKPVASCVNAPGAGGCFLHLAPCAKRRLRAPGVHGAASSCKKHPPGSAGGDKKPQLWTKKKLPGR